ncbi:hypothetical protein OG462_34520 [Streptomyces sp. NBC_01077]|uniref:hypothetical protein n=1 Tax=Streptomyces sp. NBC_01077 TaxID=2903746 RepID=UPI00386DF994|nr:hypothetical protein OG462_34520 [Streptomyces sp. NBC_01077]
MLRARTMLLGSDRPSLSQDRVLTTVSRRRICRSRHGRWSRTGSRSVDGRRPERIDRRPCGSSPGWQSRASPATGATFLVAAKRYENAHTDFMEAVALLDGDTRPSIVTRT